MKIMKKKIKYNNLDELIEDFGKNLSPKDKSTFSQCLNNLNKSKDIFFGKIPSSDHGIRSGDIVRVLASGEIGFVVGPLNAFPNNPADVMVDTKVPGYKRYLVVTLKADGTGYEDILNSITGFKDPFGGTGPTNSTFTSSKSYFGVRYPRASGMEILVRETGNNSTVDKTDIEEYCNVCCILECDGDCPLYRYKNCN